MTQTAISSNILIASGVREALRLMVESGQVFEIRALEATRMGESSNYQSTYGGYFNNIDDALDALHTLRSAMGIYITLQPCQTALLARANNRLRKQKTNSSTSDKDILRYSFLPIDCDPERPAGISSTDKEHEQALTQARFIREELRNLGWPEPLLADSGNGSHLLYKIDLGSTDKELVKRVLEGLGARFDTPDVHVDKTLFNPARIIKLYGTLACKGDDTEERPHRMSRLLEAPQQLQVVSRELLEAIATPAEEKESAYTKALNQKRALKGGHGNFALEPWLQKHNILVKSSGPYEGGTRYLLHSCVWDSSHTDHSACVYQFADGRIGASCSHNSCRGKGWKEFRQVFEPNVYTDKKQALRIQRENNNSEKQVSEDDGKLQHNDAPLDKDAIDQAIESKDINTLFNVVPLLAQLTKSEYLPYEVKIKSAFGKAINMNSFTSALVEARKRIRSESVAEDYYSEYEKTDEGMAYKAKDGLVVISNFTAEIVADITTDDGAEQTRSYGLEALLFSRHLQFDIPAREFAKCDWIDERLGARARVTTGPSMKSHLINAIKFCSNPGEQFHYAHTGWRKINGAMVYLHNDGYLSQVSQVPSGKNNHLTQDTKNSDTASKAIRERENSVISQVSQVSQVNNRASVKLSGPLAKYKFPSLTTVALFSGDSLVNFVDSPDLLDSAASKSASAVVSRVSQVVDLTANESSHVLDSELQKRAIRSSLRLVDLTEDTITMPLYSSLWRSVLPDIDYGVHIAGQSGQGKTEIAALIQQHFGAEMNAHKLPGSWESTENSLEMLLFQAKDAVVVIDDFKPKGGKIDQDRLHAKADRIFRSIGNGSGRGRLTSNLEQRVERRPRCLLISTGEDVPRGQSLKARGVVLTMTGSLTSGEVSKRLGEAQKDARNGLYAQAMASYITWLAPQIETIQEQWSDLLAAERERLSIAGHARSGTNTANMVLGMKFFLQFATQCEAITREEAQSYLTRCIDALKKIAGAAHRENQQDKPSEQWRRLVMAAIVNKTAHLVTTNGDHPGLEYGWVKSVRTIEFDGKSTDEETVRGGGSQIGWIDGENIYLMPVAAYKVARQMGTQTGDDITTLETTLRKFLVQDKMLASTDLDKPRGTITVRRRLENVQRDVLHLKAVVLFPDDSPINSVDLPDLTDSTPSDSSVDQTKPQGKPEKVSYII